ncbi:MAG: hypothetical protein K2Q10_12195 [Rhodospirillales bacterium]|nr:hypothetical protein [Rhodospirillales bacterium]
MKTRLGDPEEFLGRLCAGLPGSPRLTRLESEGEAVRLRALCALANGMRVLRLDISLDFGTGEADLGEMLVEEDWACAGLTRLVLRNLVEALTALEMRSLALFAGADLGGYAWARLGFLPDDEGWAMLRQGITTCNALWGALKPPAKQALAAFLEAGPVGTRLIANMSEMATVGGERQSVGRHALAGSSWYGVLDLAEGPARRHFALFVGEQA